MKYIAFEGVDTLGKSTQIALAASALNAKCIAEPAALGLEFKKLLTGFKLCSKARMFLFLADRAQLFAKLQEENSFAHNAPMLLSDRSLISHLAYALDCDLQELLAMNLLATNNKLPDAVVYFKASEELLAQRLGAKEVDALEDLEYLKAVAKRYDEVLDFLSLRTLIIDANQSIKDIHKQIINFINSL